MNKLTITLFLALTCLSPAWTQCLPNGITLTTQAEVDQFSNDYPGCTEIAGNLNIGSSNINDITNLNGLSQIEKIGGNLVIFNVYNLSTLNGLNNLYTVGGSLTLNANDILESLAALESLKTIGGALAIYSCNALTSMKGLENLTTATLVLENNAGLVTLNGLQNLKDNRNNDLTVYNNDALTDLIPIANIDPATIFNIHITDNASLSICSVVSICGYLGNAGAPATISGNSTGCLSRSEVGAECASSGCPTGDLIFSSQSEVNAFPLGYSNCTNFSGNVTIGTPSIGDILDLRPLSQLQSVGGRLRLFSNDGLQSLNGLNHIKSVGGDLFIDSNRSLFSPAGLDGLETVGGILYVISCDSMVYLDGLWNVTSTKGLSFQNNNSLQYLYGLRYLTNLGGGELDITNNAKLINIAAIRDIDPASIGTLKIQTNPMLSWCNVKSVCQYLDNATSSATISGNAAGCGDRAAIEAACDITFGTQLGQELVGEGGDEERFGEATSLSSDGTRLAIGAPGYNNKAGHAGVYEFQNNTWTLLGSFIQAQTGEYYLGSAVALSGNGTRLAVAISDSPLTFNNENEHGSLRVYEFQNSNWMQIGNTITGLTNNISSNELAFSENGNRLTVAFSSGFNTEGYVKVFEWQNNDWVALGGTLITPEINIQLSVAISTDGNRVAVGQPQGGGDPKVKVFDWDTQTSNWLQVGADINGLFNAVALSSDGNRLVVGNPMIGMGAGNITVYEWQNAAWVQLGAQLVGEDFAAYGYDVDISADGSRIAVSAPYSSDPGDYAGKVTTYDWANNAWTPVGNQIKGQDAYENLGECISLSSNGKIMAVSAAWTTGDDRSPGAVRAYGLSLSSSTTTIAGLEVTVYPNPSTGFVLIDGITPDVILVTDAQGRLVKQQHNGRPLVDLRSLPAGVYFLRIGANRQSATVKVIKE